MNFDSILKEYNIPYEPVGLYAPIAYALNAGGKRLRPTLVTLAYRMLGGEDTQTVYPIAIALEIFHNFSLVHDDLMDMSDTRRGIDTVQKKWNTNTAILSGDRMLILAYEFILKAKIPPADTLHILTTFNRMASQLCEGQQLDTDFENSTTVSYNEYIRMVTCKTAVLFATSLQIGAFLSYKATQAQLEKIYQIGIKLGVAFQIQDDLLDIFGNNSELGKPIGKDIIDKKKTYPLIIALQQADAATQEKLNTLIMGNLPDNEKIGKVQQLYTTLQIKEIGKKEIEKLYHQINNDLSSFPSNSYREEMENIINHLITRKK